MTSAARFPDWFDLPKGRRADAIQRSQTRLESIGRRLHAVANIFSAEIAVRGSLAGMTYVAKDMIATGRAEPSWGCVAPVSEQSEIASVVARFDGAGASLIGAAEMTELAYEPSGMNAARGAVLNPWSFDHVPGGSSSGSAALVASGCCFAALGSDTGGSVRIPAHCCGVTALKPTYGVVPSDGTMPLSPSLDTIGILARSAADLSLVWPVVAGTQAAPTPPVPIAATVMKEAFAASAPEVTRIIREAFEILASCGMAFFERDGFPEAADGHCLLVMQAEAARAHRGVIDDSRVDAVLRKRLRKGLAISDGDLEAALGRRDALREEFMTQYLRDAAIVLLPVMPMVTPAVSEVDPAAPPFNPKTLYAMSRFTRFVNYLGLPALALPAGFDSRGLPVGLQMIGAPGSETLLLSVARKFQSITDWHGRVPTAISADIAAERELAA
jgi:aspartyl-tRNA(Asn)/glutamyl-tRNA(Gln) amidotransferase subunit A